MRILAELASVFAQFSLLAFGGANAVLPEMQRQVVDVHHWMNAREFAALFALAQAAPGPNMMVVSLVGWRVAGFWGALVTTGAVAAPSSMLTLLVSGHMVPVQGCRLAHGAAGWAATGNGRPDHGQCGVADPEHGDRLDSRDGYGGDGMAVHFHQAASDVDSCRRSGRWGCRAGWLIRIE